jgi:hypothetical protein
MHANHSSRLSRTPPRSPQRCQNRRLSSRRQQQRTDAALTVPLEGSGTPRRRGGGLGDGKQKNRVDTPPPGDRGRERGTERLQSFYLWSSATAVACSTPFRSPRRTGTPSWWWKSCTTIKCSCACSSSSCVHANQNWLTRTTQVDSLSKVVARSSQSSGTPRRYSTSKATAKRGDDIHVIQHRRSGQKGHCFQICSPASAVVLLQRRIAQPPRAHRSVCAHANHFQSLSRTTPRSHLIAHHDCHTSKRT